MRVREQEGVIIALDGQVAKVRVSRHLDCDSCDACAGEGAAVLDAYNSINAGVGQRVSIEMEEANMLKAAFIVYFLPLIGTFIGFLIGYWIAHKYLLPPVPVEVGACILALFLTMLYVRRYDRAMAGLSKMPKINGILSS